MRIYKDNTYLPKTSLVASIAGGLMFDENTYKWDLRHLEIKPDETEDDLEQARRYQ